ncbi:MAG: phosphopentomutase [Ruminococcus sp.]|nr:phosphopentomutase [Candidatus Apopatosoma intestinale]
MNRVFLIVMDSFGCGKSPDAAAFGDEGADTLASVISEEGFSAPNLQAMGLFNIRDAAQNGPTACAVASPVAAYGALREMSAGKDTTIGHWEIAGIYSETPLPTYPNGFPKEILDEFSRRTGRGVLCNKTYSGTDVIRDYGEEHIRTGSLIIYTSADSVFQIAAHEAVVPVDELYRYCEIAREILVGEHGVGRVIARPFEGEFPYRRTSRRHDFSAEPPKKTLLDVLSEAGLATECVGKIGDIFAGKGVTNSVRTAGNDDGMDKTVALLDKDFHGLGFINLVDFDSSYGHRRDARGYADAVMQFDRRLSEVLPKLREDDVLMITADHGCDPLYRGTDHTRERIPLLIYGKKIKPVDLDVRSTYSDIAATVADLLGVPYTLNGTSFAEEILQ